MKQYLLFETEEVETSAEAQNWGTFKTAFMRQFTTGLLILPDFPMIESRGDYFLSSSPAKSKNGWPEKLLMYDKYQSNQKGIQTTQ